jgi:hypothetical protein
VCGNGSNSSNALELKYIPYLQGFWNADTHELWADDQAFITQAKNAIMCVPNSTLEVRDAANQIQSGVRIIIWDKNGNFVSSVLDGTIDVPENGYSATINFWMGIGDFEGFALLTKEEVSKMTIHTTLNEIETNFEIKLSDETLQTGFWNKDGGNFLEDAAYKSTDRLIFTGGAISVADQYDNVIFGIRVVFWDINGNQLGYATTDYFWIAVPANTYYAAINILTQDIESDLVVYTEAEIARMRIVGVKSNVIDNSDSGSGASLVNSTLIDMQIPKNNFVLRGGYSVIAGASFASAENGWFELGCRQFGGYGVNRAVDGESIKDTANKMAAGTFWGDEFDYHDMLVIMHVHNQDVYNSPNLKEKWTDYSGDFLEQDYAVAFDYVIKRYISDCYNQKDIPSSFWYGSKFGRPVQIALCTHWHDARTVYNNSVRKLCAKWRIPLIAFDENIGFTSAEVNQNTNQQTSLLFSDDFETIDGVVYGWHPMRGQQEFIQKKMAKIFANFVLNVSTDFYLRLSGNSPETPFMGTIYFPDTYGFRIRNADQSSDFWMDGNSTVLYARDDDSRIYLQSWNSAQTSVASISLVKGNDVSIGVGLNGGKLTIGNIGNAIASMGTAIDGFLVYHRNNGVLKMTKEEFKAWLGI